MDELYWQVGYGSSVPKAPDASRSSSLPKDQGKTYYWTAYDLFK
jgi:hypothetical protein